MTRLDNKEYIRHEALDRTHIVISMIDDVLCNHEYFRSRPDLMEQITKINTELAEIYQKIGLEHLDDSEE